MIKNNYPLPLILDIVENIGIKKIFTKLNLRWEYNNIQIKKENKWKVAFTTLEGSFEPTIMFFGLTNFLAIFQTMMNKILWNLIDTGEVASFIDNVIVGMKKKEEHDKAVEEVVKNLVENNLYVYIKPEKYKWKVRKVGFLEIVIVLERIKMEKVKVKGVLDWPTSKRVKDIQKFLGLINYYQQFIKDFVFIARLLYDLMEKNQK